MRDARNEEREPLAADPGMLEEALMWVEADVAQ